MNTHTRQKEDAMSIMMRMTDQAYSVKKTIHDIKRALLSDFLFRLTYVKSSCPTLFRDPGKLVYHADMLRRRVRDRRIVEYSIDRWWLSSTAQRSSVIRMRA